ncbi:RimJ/RimL family protein N-acetyltransferase [Murinocardiopsis flavida]|uniref:RimJ/RimL family protein N-acetyltransferase n=1 Tax=Murinocardiopsis flavida TaxID=645275 RepID=A0A2P8DLU0_9ACTN|nr:GNAT family protein [Murinocardiopsis flavida]PSK98168.1 RimJ/RimL family protein N-acetyltransferase [Murinocardiopsis flavida]
MIDINALRKRPTLTGENVRLVPLTEEHADGVHATIANAEVARLRGAHSKPGADEVEEWCAGLEGRTDRLDLAITEEPGGRYVGELALVDIDPDNETAEYRISLASIEFTGYGIGKEATRLVLAHAFDNLGLHRVWLEVYSFNMRAISAYRACGFTVEGRLRETLLWAGRRYDALVMAVLEDEFRKSVS